MNNDNAFVHASTTSPTSALSLGWTEPVMRADEPTETLTVASTNDAPAQPVEICPAVSERGPPAELVDLPQWVAYRLESNPDRPEKHKKIPYCSQQRRASTTDPATWLSYAAAVDLARTEGFAGIGFVFTAADPYTGTDFDGVRDPATGAIAPWAFDAVQQLGSYAEVSPSGTGIHSISRAKLGDGALKTKTVEVYDRERFFTFTGQVLDGYDTVRDSQAAVEALVARHRPKAKTAGPLPPPRNTELDDKAVVAQILASGRAKDFHRLFIAGETRTNQSESESDFLLACILAEQLGGDVDRIERLMRDSALADRKKWGRKDYVASTIRMAIRAVATSKANNAPESTEARPAAEPLKRISVSALARNPKLLEPPPMLLSRLVWAGRFSLFAGREKDGKTTYAAWAVVQAAKAGLGVLWLSTDEDQPTVVGRFVRIAEQGLGITDPAERDAILERIDVLDRDPTGWEEVETQHTAGWRPDVYVVDTLSSFLMAVDGKVPETSEGELWQAKVLRFKSWIKGTPAGVLLLVHANRADGTYRGSTGIGAAPDAIITYFGGLTDACCRRVERKGRFGIGSATVTIRYLGDEHPGFEEVEAAGVAVNKKAYTDDELSSIRRLCEAPGPLRAGEWEKGTKDQFNVSRAVVNRARQKAEKDGFIAHTADKSRWQVTPAGWQFAGSQKGWSPTRYPYEPATVGEMIA